MLIVGVDPGLHGALAFLEPEKRRAQVVLTPLRNGTERDDYDEDALCQLLGDHGNLGPLVVVYEQLGSLPPVRADGKAMGGGIANHRRGLAIGILRGILAALRVPRERRIAVLPQVWQRAMLLNLPGADTKARSVWLARRLFPDISLLPTARSRKPHDGMADALCLAEYGRRLLAGDKGRQRGLLEVSA